MSLFLLNGLDAARQYAIKWLMFDTSGNISSSTGTIIVSTPAYDQTPPLLTSNTLTERTATTAKLHLVTDEQLKTIRIRYRLVGSTTWTEQALTPSGLTFDVNLTGLLSGQTYEYQYILDDNNNQTITEWVTV